MRALRLTGMCQNQNLQDFKMNRILTILNLSFCKFFNPVNSDSDEFIDLFFTAQIDCAVVLFLCGVESGRGGVNAWRKYRSQSRLTPQPPLFFKERGRHWRAENKR